MRFPDSFIFNGLLPWKMVVNPYTALVSVLSGQKLVNWPFRQNLRQTQIKKPPDAAAKAVTLALAAFITRPQFESNRRHFKDKAREVRLSMQTPVQCAWVYPVIRPLATRANILIMALLIRWGVL
jgi:hypothetical protein